MKSFIRTACLTAVLATVSCAAFATPADADAGSPGLTRAQVREQLVAAEKVNSLKIDNAESQERFSLAATASVHDAYVASMATRSAQASVTAAAPNQIAAR